MLVPFVHQNTKNIEKTAPQRRFFNIFGVLMHKVVNLCQMYGRWAIKENHSLIHLEIKEIWTEYD